MSRNKQLKKTTISLITISIIFSMIPLSSIVIGQTDNNMETVANLSVTPNPVGINQYVLVFCLLVPPASPTTDFRFKDFEITITDPTGHTETLVKDASDLTASVTFSYTPTMLGDYKFQWSFPGQWVNFTQYNWYYEPVTSPVVTLHVQEDQIPPYQEAPLPTYWWERPLYGVNREWYQIGGNWMTPGYNASMAYYNPYTTGPESSHILWAEPVNIGGMIGGEPFDIDGRSSIEGGFRGRPVQVILMGIAYINLPDGIHAMDAKTGETLWVKEGSLTGATYGTSIANAQIVPKPELIELSSSNLVKRDPFTGAVTLNVAGYRGTFADPYVYSKVGNNLVKWTTIGSSSNFASRVIWNVTIPSDIGAPNVIWDHYGYSVGRTTPQQPAGIPSKTYCFDLDTGELLWDKVLPFTTDTFTTAGYGKMYVYGKNATIEAYNLDDGSLAWKSEQFPWPFGTFFDYAHAVAYGNVYMGTYAGLICVDANNGEIKWIFHAPNSGYETVYDEYAFWGGPLVADGKVYITNGEHSPTQPFQRGANLFCVDAYNGTELWRMSQLYGGSGNAKQIADGVLYSTNDYDQVLYAFGKGPSKTTIIAPNSGVTTSTQVTITGSVTDISAGAQKNVVTANFPNGLPCVSEDSMTSFMEAVYMQQPMPTDTTGVEVRIQVIDPNGEYAWIGTTTTDLNGNYGYSFIPQTKGMYTIIASFVGSEAYYGSSQTTFMSVDTPTAYPTYPGYQGPSASEVAQNVVNSLPDNPTSEQIAQAVINQMPEYPEIPEQQEAPDYTNMFIIVFVLVAIAIVIGLVSLFRKK